MKKKTVSGENPPSVSQDAPQCLSPEQMDALGACFRAKREKAAIPSQALARTRIWVVFLLIRYAGLRLGEALGLDDKNDVNLAEARISVRGRHARVIPMALPLLAQLQRVLDEPATESVRGRLTRLDPGHVRRRFYACAEECGLGPDTASPRAVRHARGAELLRGGLPMPVVERFLGAGGRANGLSPYSREEGAHMLRNHLHRETVMKTSARNLFSGRVTSIRQRDFLAEVVIRTLSGLEVSSIITEESLNNLELYEGKPVVATIKAPWVGVRRAIWGDRDARNGFTGRVIRVQTSSLATEVVLALKDGSHMCALDLFGGGKPPDMAPGDEVFAHFKAFAVVLTAVR